MDSAPAVGEYVLGAIKAGANGTVCGREYGFNKEFSGPELLL